MYPVAINYDSEGACPTMKLFLLAGAIALFSLTVPAQKPGGQTAARPNFAGTWEYAERGTEFKDRVLVITQTGDEIGMVETYLFKGDPYTQKATLYTDNRGEVNMKQFPGGGGASQIISNTNWKKDKLFVKLRYAYMMDNRGMRYKVTVDEEQTWSLSEDGETLTVNIKSSRDAPAITPIAVPTTGKSVYKRKN